MTQFRYTAADGIQFRLRTSGRYVDAHNGATLDVTGDEAKELAAIPGWEPVKKPAKKPGKKTSK